METNVEDTEARVLESPPGESYGSDTRNPAKDLWQPDWEIDVAPNSKLGIVMDDGCFVVLYPTEAGQWRPGTHIPAEVARFIGALATNGKF